MLAQPALRPNQRRSDIFYSQTLNIPTSQHWTQAAASIPSPAQSHYSDVTTSASDIYTFGTDEPLFDFKPHPHPQYQQYNSNSSMQSEHNNSWLSNGQLTPTSTTTKGQHHRESSLSSLGSAGPASPYTVNTSNPQVAGDLYHEYPDYQQSTSKPITPVHTPSQEPFLVPQYQNYYANNHLIGGGYTMSNDGLPKTSNTTGLMPVPEFNGHSGRPSVASVARNDSPSTPPAYDDQRSKNAFRQAPKLDRTMTDVYEDELYNPNFQFSAPTSSTPAVTATLSPQNDVFTQTLMAANNQHLSASVAQTPLTIPARDTSPFRRGSPLAPSGSTFGNGFGSASSMRERQKLENDARALQEQIRRTSPEQLTPKTISPKDVELEYHESEEDMNMPLFPPAQQQQRSPVTYRQTPPMKLENELDETASQQSYNSMATSRRPSSSTFSTSSQATQQTPGSFHFAPSSVPGSVQRVTQQYPFVPVARRQPSTLSNVEQFTPTLSSMESSSSEYTETDIKKPTGTSADTGTYTCTYHGCTLRFETPAKLQRHKREGHRNSASASAIASNGGEEGGMTSAALRNTQNGPHKCERINPSTGKPCNTIFSRPYDLTRHEDTIHNARKQKVRCHLCTEEKTFSRNDALTRHFRVCHPDHVELHKTRRRNGRD
jgi:26S proteasome regulatory subunit N4